MTTKCPCNECGRNLVFDSSQVGDEEVCPACQKTTVLYLTDAEKKRIKHDQSCPYVCATCGSRERGRNNTKGSFAIELVLWLFFLLPGLLYSIWRLTSKERVCSQCGSSELIPVNAPRARQILRETQQA